MSRYDIKPKNPEHVVVVGWDAPLNSFFAQVKLKAADEEADPLLWFGATAPRIHDIDEVKRRLAPFADIPNEINVKLRANSD